MESKGKGKKGKTGAIADGRREDDVKGKGKKGHTEAIAAGRREDEVKGTGKKGKGKGGDAAEQQREDEAKGKGKHSNTGAIADGRGGDEVKGKGKKGKVKGGDEQKREDEVKGKGKKGKVKGGDETEQKREDAVKGKGKKGNVGGGDDPEQKREDAVKGKGKKGKVKGGDETEQKREDEAKGKGKKGKVKGGDEQRREDAVKGKGKKGKVKGGDETEQKREDKAKGKGKKGKAKGGDEQKREDEVKGKGKKGTVKGGDETEQKREDDVNGEGQQSGEESNQGEREEQGLPVELELAVRNQLEKLDDVEFVRRVKAAKKHPWVRDWWYHHLALDDYVFGDEDEFEDLVSFEGYCALRQREAEEQGKGSETGKVKIEKEEKVDAQSAGKKPEAKEDTWKNKENEDSLSRAGSSELLQTPAKSDSTTPTTSPGSVGKTPPSSSNRSPALRRPLSAVSLDGITEKDGNGRVKRVKVLSPEQHDAISQLTCSSQLPHSERKRQFGALHRRMQHTNTLPAGVLAKWERATTPQQKFEFLKCFMLDPDLNNVHVETWHKEAAVSENKAKFIELPLDELELKYDKDWLQERIVKRQKGKPHPQDPSNERKRLYKVFDRIVDSSGTKTSTGHCLKGTAKVSDNKAMKSSLAEVITHKQAAYRDPMVEQLSIEDGNVNGEPDPKRQRKHPKKELTEAQKKQQDFDKNMKEIQSLSVKARSAAAKLREKGIQHQEALIEGLSSSCESADELYKKLNDMLFRGKSIADVVDRLNSQAEEDVLKDCVKKIKDAELIVQAHDRRLAAEKRAQEAKNNPDAKAKNKAKAKPKKKPAQQAGEASGSVFEKLEQDENNGAEDMENAIEHPVEDQHGS